MKALIAEDDITSQTMLRELVAAWGLNLSLRVTD